MNRNVMIVLAGGFLIAVLVALLVQASLSGGKKEEQPVVVAEEPKVQIIVASKDLKIGAELTEEDMKWQSWPKNAVFPGAVVREEKKKTLEMLSGRLSREVKEGEPITESALVQKGNYLAAALTPGMRAYAISVKAQTMVGGFVSPGDYVDVLLTYRQKVTWEGDDNPDIENMIEMNIDDMATETILQNVKVLAVDQSVSRNQDEDGKVKVGKTISLEVDYKGAEILALASEFGDLSMALRGLGDDHIIFEKPPVTTDARITNIFDEILLEISKVSGTDYSGQAGKVVRIYSGQAVQDVPVRQ